MSRPWQADLDREAELLPHEFGNVDDCVRCIHCEVLPSRASGPCTARAAVQWIPCWACEGKKLNVCGGGCIDGFVPRVVERGR